MSEPRRYTVDEIDALRGAAESRYLFGTTATNGSAMSRCYMEQDKVKAVEEMVRTYMRAGITAEEIYTSDKKKVAG